MFPTGKKQKNMLHLSNLKKIKNLKYIYQFIEFLPPIQDQVTGAAI